MSWFTEFVFWLVRWVPRFGICRSTHQGLKFKHGRTAPILPGLFMYWPLTTECVLIPVVQYSVDLAAQTLVTKDDRTVVVSLVLVVEIANATKAISRAHDVDDVIVEVGGAVAVRTVVSRTWADLRAALESDDLTEELTARARKLLRPFGVRVLQARLTECSQARTIRLINNGTGIG